jgi:hypothetical protein
MINILERMQQSARHTFTIQSAVAKTHRDECHKPSRTIREKIPRFSDA